MEIKPKPVKTQTPKKHADFVYARQETKKTDAHKSADLCDQILEDIPVCETTRDRSVTPLPDSKTNAAPFSGC